jgi:hypothetical protein
MVFVIVEKNAMTVKMEKRPSKVSGSDWFSDDCRYVTKIRKLGVRTNLSRPWPEDRFRQGQCEESTKGRAPDKNSHWLIGDRIYDEIGGLSGGGWVWVDPISDG